MSYTVLSDYYDYILNLSEAGYVIWLKQIALEVINDRPKISNQWMPPGITNAC